MKIKIRILTTPGFCTLLGKLELIATRNVQTNQNTPVSTRNMNEKRTIKTGIWEARLTVAGSERAEMIDHVTWKPTPDKAFLQRVPLALHMVFRNAFPSSYPLNCHHCLEPIFGRSGQAGKSRITTWSKCEQNSCDLRYNPKKHN